MAGFRKAKAEQAALKIAIYGPPGSGKSFTSLLFAEGLAAASKKRIAYIDTEHGTDFYCKTVPSRKVHPAAFDFDALYTRSLTEVLENVKALNTAEHGVLIIDSITHLWEAAIAAHKGKTTSIGSIPMHAWGNIKKPYKELMSLVLSSPLHVIICGRQGNEFDDVDGELKKVGVKMKAEGETAYEPHICLRMASVRMGDDAVVEVFGEKDRTGVLANRTIRHPNFDNVIKPLLTLLGGTQAKMATEEETASKDAEAMADAEAKKAKESAALLEEYDARFKLAKTKEDVEAVGKLITPDVKKKMTTADVASAREFYLKALDRATNAPQVRHEPVAEAPAQAAENMDSEPETPDPDQTFTLISEKLESARDKQELAHAFRGVHINAAILGEERKKTLGQLYKQLEAKL